MKKWLFFKRSLDIVFSILAIFLLLPIWLLISLAIYFEDRGPLFFKQKRIGINQKLFTIYKFRSMRINNIPPIQLGAIKHQHSLVTRVGYFIRRFKLDETPQFLNVLKGEMSLVGPRPCLPERISHMSPFEKRRFAHLPGLTGWAEINGNVELTWEEQLLLDLWYVENASFLLDLLISIKTLLVVIIGSHKNETALNNAKKLFSLRSL